jgi:hypothetical protein
MIGGHEETRVLFGMAGVMVVTLALLLAELWWVQPSAVV